MVDVNQTDAPEGYVAVKSPGGVDVCARCDLGRLEVCDMGACEPQEREDGFDVYFVKTRSGVSELTEEDYIGIYMHFHVSQMGDQPEPIKKAWSIGQELYAARVKDPE